MTGAREVSDGELLRRVRGGDEEAFRLIYDRCHGPIYRFAVNMTGNTFIAEDVTQELFMTLIQGSLNFDPARGALPAYLFGIGRKLLLRRLQTEKAFVALSGAGADDASSALDSSRKLNGSQNGTIPELLTLPADPLSGERIDRVRQAIFSLPPNYREVVALCDLQEMSYEEAAAVLDCAVGTVRSRLHRARSLLSDKLREFREPQQKVGAGMAKL